MNKLVLQIWAIYKKELKTIFFSPIAFVVLTAFLFVNGFIFDNILLFIASPNTPGVLQVMNLFFGNLFFWILLLITVPIITMRTLSEEFRQGTFETLMTVSIQDFQVILGKYLACCTFFVFLWLPTLSYPALLQGKIPLDWGPIICGYTGTFFVGFLFIAVGIFTSSLTANQIISAILCFSINIFLFSASITQSHIADGFLKEIINYTNLFNHILEFKRGIIDTRHIVFYLSFIFLMLFLSTRVLESQRWK
ncbi:hypothetical protein ACFL35_17750 [Candidatus Riflebacteria bacterium]